MTDPRRYPRYRRWLATQREQHRLRLADRIASQARRARHRRARQRGEPE